MGEAKEAVIVEEVDIMEVVIVEEEATEVAIVEEEDMEIMVTTLVAIIMVLMVVVINPFIMIESPKELKVVVVTPLNLLPSFETPFSLVTLLLAGYNCGYWAFGLDICSCIGPSILSYV